MPAPGSPFRRAREAASPLLLAVLLVLICVGLAAGGATLALIQPGISTVDADISSKIVADYSINGNLEFAPLDPEIVDVVRSDEAGLDGDSGSAEIVQVFYEDPPAPGEQAPPIFVNAQPTPTPSGPLPPAGITDSPTPTLKPGQTPPPTPRTDPTRTPAPTPRVIMTPTAPPTVTPQPTPTPTPPPAWPDSCYLYNDPSPPTGDTVYHHDLWCGITAPTAAALYNYDVDIDDGPGRSIHRSHDTPGNVQDQNHQHWRTPAAPAGLVMNGSAKLDLWIAAKDVQSGKMLQVSGYLLDLSASGSSVIAQGHVATTSSGGFSPVTISMGVGHTLPPGHWLEIMVIVPNASQDDVWVAYDTAQHKSKLVLP